MYSKCDEDGNEYVLLDSLFYYKNNKNVLSLEDQNIFVKGREYLCRSTVGWRIFFQWKNFIV